MKLKKDLNALMASKQQAVKRRVIKKKRQGAFPTDLHADDDTGGLGDDELKRIAQMKAGGEAEMTEQINPMAKPAARVPQEGLI